MAVKRISPQDIIYGTGLILDVRTAMECAEKRLCCNHHHVPLDQLDAKTFMAQQGLSKESDLYILCRSGQRATMAAERFIKEGMINVYVIEGGILSCEECGQKLEGHLIKTETSLLKKYPISLERQMRITAGLLVLMGSLLGFFVEPDFLFIPAFVGAGLIFAGVTDRCGMVLLLTRMPWNKI
jgi:rhodanese-related sulfurtransferase